MKYEDYKTIPLIVLEIKKMESKSLLNVLTLDGG